MSETVIARFDHHWQAEYAQGFLEEADLPSRILTDNLAVGHFYTGELAGASLLVAESLEDRARSVLEDAGLLEPKGIETDSVPSLPEDASPVLRADVEDLEERLRLTRRREMKHGIYAMLGLTPAALIPLVGLALEGSVGLMVVLCVLIVFVEGWRWIRTGHEAERLEKELEELRAPGG